MTTSDDQALAEQLQRQFDAEWTQVQNQQRRDAELARLLSGENGCGRLPHSLATDCTAVGGNRGTGANSGVSAQGLNTTVNSSDDCNAEIRKSGQFGTTSVDCCRNVFNCKGVAGGIVNTACRNSSSAQVCCVKTPVDTKQEVKLFDQFSDSKPLSSTLSVQRACDRGAGSSISNPEVSKEGQQRKRSLSAQCRYGNCCYRRNNAAHCAQYSHDDNGAPSATASSATPAASSRSDHHPTGSSGQRRVSVAQRVAAAQPLSLFLTKVRSIRDTWSEPLSLGLPELFDPSLGRLQCSLQINFLVDVEWLLEAYAVHNCHRLPLTVLCGANVSTTSDGANDSVRLPSNVSVDRVRMPYAYGVHHTKMMILKYGGGGDCATSAGGGIRVVVHTANMIEADWTDKTQGVWVSPLLPPSSGDSVNSRDSVTGFRADLLAYLGSYQLSCLQNWRHLVASHDFSSVRVFFIGSVPGRHSGTANNSGNSSDSSGLWGHWKLARALKRNRNQPHEQYMPHHLIVAQCSSIGSLGKCADSWLHSQLVAAMKPDTVATGASSCASHPAPLVDTSNQQPPPAAAPAHVPLQVCVIYPSRRNVAASVEGAECGGSSLAYRRATHVKQLWLRRLFYQWHSETRHRSRAMPHVKTYAHLSVGTLTSGAAALNATRCHWLLLSSSNLSKAAWGCEESGGSKLFIRSFEAGVLFLPALFDCRWFQVSGAASGTLATGENQTKLRREMDSASASDPCPFVNIHLPYSLPLLPYGDDDNPWFSDFR